MYEEINEIATIITKNYKALTAVDEANIIKANPKNIVEIIFNAQSKFIVGWAIPRVSKYISFQELISTSIIAIQNALSSYNGSTRFNTHLRAHLTSALQEEVVTLNNTVHIPQHLFKANMIKKQKALKENIINEYKEQVLGLKPIDNNELKDELVAYDVMPTFSGQGSNEFSALDIIQDDEFNPEQKLNENQTFINIKQDMSSFICKVIDDLAFLHLSVTEIAEKHNVSRIKVNTAIKHIKAKAQSLQLI